MKHKRHWFIPGCSYRKIATYGDSSFVSHILQNIATLPCFLQCMHVCTYVCTYMYIYMHTYILHTNICICTYIDTHTHIHTKHTHIVPYILLLSLLKLHVQQNGSVLTALHDFSIHTTYQHQPKMTTGSMYCKLQYVVHISCGY